MKTILVKNYEEMSQVAHDMIAEVINETPAPVISMTTGGTPRGLFEKLVVSVNGQKIDLSETTILNLDEYMGPKNAPYSVYNYMYQSFYDQITVQPKNIYLIDGQAKDAKTEIADYKKILAEHPRDVQVLGLGTNGHIGANEPGTPFDQEIFLAQHDESTIESTMREYGISREDAPTEMITLGFSEILEAKLVLLLVSGTRKAQAVKNVLEGPITTECPASFLRDKKNVVLIVDEEAAALLDGKVE